MAIKELQEAQTASEAQQVLTKKQERINLMKEVVAMSEETEKTELMKKIGGFLIELKPQVESVFAKSYTDTMTNTERATAGLTRAWEKLSEQHPEPGSTITTKGNFDKVKQEGAPIDISEFRKEVEAVTGGTTPPEPKDKPKDEPPTPPVVPPAPEDGPKPPVKKEPKENDPENFTKIEAEEFIDSLTITSGFTMDKNSITVATDGKVFTVDMVGTNGKAKITFNKNGELIGPNNTVTNSMNIIMGTKGYTINLSNKNLTIIEKPGDVLPPPMIIKGNYKEFSPADEQVIAIISQLPYGIEVSAKIKNNPPIILKDIYSLGNPSLKIASDGSISAKNVSEDVTIHISVPSPNGPIEGDFHLTVKKEAEPIDNTKPHEIPIGTMAGGVQSYKIEQGENLIGQSYDIAGCKAGFLSYETLKTKGYINTQGEINFDAMKKDLEKGGKNKVFAILPGGQYTDKYKGAIKGYAKENGTVIANTNEGADYGGLGIDSNGSFVITHGKEVKDMNNYHSYVSLPSYLRNGATLDGGKLNGFKKKFLVELPGGARRLVTLTESDGNTAITQLKAMGATRAVWLDTGTPGDGVCYNTDGATQTLGNISKKGFNNIIIFYT